MDRLELLQDHKGPVIRQSLLPTLWEAGQQVLVWGSSLEMERVHLPRLT